MVNPTAPRVAVVTGANKGIGLAIVRNLALHYHRQTNDNAASNPVVIYLTARSVERGTAALKKLDGQLRAQFGTTGNDTTNNDQAITHSNVTIIFHHLDVTQALPIETLTKHLQSTYPEGIDLLVNNAGIAIQGLSPNIAHSTIATNYDGTLYTSLALLPLLRPNGRVVNLSSFAAHLDGKFSPYPHVHADEFRAMAAAKKRVEGVSYLMKRYKEAVEAGEEADDPNFPYSAYAVSKAGVVAVTQVLAREQSVKERKILINVCCPGYVDTDMTEGKGILTVDEGAAVPIHLAIGDIGGVTGEFWREGKVVEW